MIFEIDLLYQFISAQFLFIPKDVKNLFALKNISCYHSLVNGWNWRTSF
jgi:hypothetical protein